MNAFGVGADLISYNARVDAEEAEKPATPGDLEIGMSNPRGG